jgi:hypothetical protein
LDDDELSNTEETPGDAPEPHRPESYLDGLKSAIIVIGMLFLCVSTLFLVVFTPLAMILLWGVVFDCRDSGGCGDSVLPDELLMLLPLIVVALIWIAILLIWRSKNRAKKT